MEEIFDLRAQIDFDHKKYRIYAVFRELFENAIENQQFCPETVFLRLESAPTHDFWSHFGKFAENQRKIIDFRFQN